MTRPILEGPRLPSQTEDGRTLRGRRTREAVVEAVIVLLNEGDVRPTAARVAERAGVSLRSVFQHFTDLEDLFATVAERQFQLVQGLPPAANAADTFERRLAAFVERRAELLERISPVRRAAVLQAPFSAVVRNRLEQLRIVGRGEIERVFASELEHASPTTRSRTVAALAAISAWTTWENLRAEQGLSKVKAQRVLADMLRAVLVALQSEAAAPEPESSAELQVSAATQPL
jgi:AcrR family transcriptional regulator